MKSQEKLLASLERTSQIVKGWPQWKKTVSVPKNIDEKNKNKETAKNH